MAKKMSTGQKILLAVVGVGVVYVAYTALTKPKPVVITPTPIPTTATSGSSLLSTSGLASLLTAAKGLFGSSTTAGSGSTASLPSSSPATAGPDIGIMSNDPLDMSSLAGVRRHRPRIVHPM